MLLGFSYNLNQTDDVFLNTDADKTVIRSEFVVETCIRCEARETRRLLLCAGKYALTSHDWLFWLRISWINSCLHSLFRKLYTTFSLSKCTSRWNISLYFRAFTEHSFRNPECFIINKRMWLHWCVFISSVPGGSVVKPCYGCHALYSQTRAFRSCCLLWGETTWPVAVWLPGPGRLVWNSNLVDHWSCISFWKTGRGIRECTERLLQETGTSLWKNSVLVGCAVYRALPQEVIFFPRSYSIVNEKAI